MYKDVNTIIAESGWDSKYFLPLTNWLESIRNGEKEYEMIVAMVLRRHFGIEMSILSLDNLPDDMNKEIEKAHKKIGTTKIKQVTKDSHISQAGLMPRTPADVKNRRIAEFALRVAKKVNAFNNIKEVLEWYYFAKDNEFTNKVVSSTIARLYNSSDKYNKALADYHTGRIRTHVFLQTLCDCGFNCQEAASLTIEEYITSEAKYDMEVRLDTIIENNEHNDDE